MSFLENLDENYGYMYFRYVVIYSSCNSRCRNISDYFFAPFLSKILFPQKVLYQGKRKNKGICKNV